MIKTINLKFGSAHGLEHASIAATPVTVFVGPNNSGKSKILNEIFEFCNSGQKNETSLILESIEFENSEEDKAQKEIKNITLNPNIGENIQLDHILVGKKGFKVQVPKQQLLLAIQNPNNNPAVFCNWYLRCNTTILNGKNRIDLVNEQNGGDLQESPHTSFQALFRDDEKRKEVRRIILEAFGVHFVIDPTYLGKLRLKLSPIAPKDNIEECGIHQEAITFHSKALDIQAASDGVKAFTGIITEIIAGDPKILLIDEPEAFLHPSLTYKLAKEIAKASVNTDKRIFVSTHSPSFVMGCIQAGTPINIVRLTYRNNVATARILPNEDILKLMRNPLLRSTGVLEGLFYEYVIVTESDTDRAFYQEVNDRLVQFKPTWGIPNCLFINAQNKQTVQTIIKPLRELGIPTAGIVDIDVLKDGGKVWTSFLNSGFIPDIAHESLGNLRSALKQKLEQTGKDMKKDGGIALLSQKSDKEAANNLFNQLNEYGLFVVRHGELEVWLKDLNISGHGPSWLIKIFEKMGENPESENYIKPTDIDVWAFIFSLKQWLDNTERKGIPS